MYCTYVSTHVMNEFIISPPKKHLLAFFRGLWISGGLVGSASTNLHLSATVWDGRLAKWLEDTVFRPTKYIQGCLKWSNFQNKEHHLIVMSHIFEETSDIPPEAQLACHTGWSFQSLRLSTWQWPSLLSAVAWVSWYTRWRGFQGVRMIFKDIQGGGWLWMTWLHHPVMPWKHPGGWCAFFHEVIQNLWVRVSRIDYDTGRGDHSPMKSWVLSVLSTSGICVLTFSQDKFLAVMGVFNRFLSIQSCWYWRPKQRSSCISWEPERLIALAP